jgi:hypothetical protein
MIAGSLPRWRRTLKFVPKEGAILELMGFFDQNISSIKKQSGSYLKNVEMENIEIILGLSSEGKEITLHTCSIIQNTQLIGKGISKSKIIVSFVFVGFHFEKKEDIEFKSVFLNYHLLDEWVAIGGIIQEVVQTPDGELKELNFNYSSPDKIKVNLGDFCLEIAWELHSNFNLNSCGLKQVAFIKIEPQNSASFDYFLNTCYSIQNFLSLGLGKATYPVIMEGIYKFPIGERIRIFYSALGENDDKSSIRSDQMLFSYSDIDGYLESCLNNWFNKKENLEPVYSLYFGTMYNSSMF